MIAIQFFLVIAFCALAFADLKGNLTSAGVTAVFPGDSGYASASTACESRCHLVHTVRSNNTPSVNLRFSFQPAAVTYPKTPQDVSEIIQLGAAYNLQVAARSGGVRFKHMQVTVS